jgi:hypothetical protein
MIEAHRIFDAMGAELMVIHDGKINPDIHEFSHAIWQTIRERCQVECDQGFVRCVLGLNQNSIAALADATEQQIDRLCLRTVLNFKFDLNETRIIQLLNQRYEGFSANKILIQTCEESEIAEAYLHLMHNVAKNDYVEAALIFGFSPRLTLALSKTSFRTIRSVARSIEAPFRLRFNEWLIPKLLSDECPVIYTTMLYQQVFSSSSCKD